MMEMEREKTTPRQGGVNQQQEKTCKFGRKELRKMLERGAKGVGLFVCWQCMVEAHGA